MSATRDREVRAGHSRPGATGDPVRVLTVWLLRLLCGVWIPSAHHPDLPRPLTRSRTAMLVARPFCRPIAARSLALALALVLTPLAGAAQSGGLTPAVQLFEQGRYTEARAALTALTRTEPRLAEAWYYLGRIALVDGDGDGGARALERAVTLNARDARYHHWLGRAYSRQAVRAGKLKQALLAGRIRGAFETAVSLAPDDISARGDLLQYYVIAPGFMGGSVDKARAQAREIAKRNPLRGRLAHGVVHERQRELHAAEAEYLAAVAESPDSAVAYYALGNMYQRTRRFAEAVALYDRLLTRQPGARAARYHIGRASSLSGLDLERGARELRAYIASVPGPEDPSLASAHYRLGLVLERQGDRAAARREFEETLRLDPRQREAQEALARVR